MPQLDLSTSYIKPIVRPYSCTGRRVCFHQSVCTTGILQTPVTNHLYTSPLVTDESCHPPVCGPAVSSKLSPVKLLPVQPVKVKPFLTAITSALFLNLITGRHCICMTEEAAHKLAKRPDKKNIASFLGLRDIGGLHFF